MQGDKTSFICFVEWDETFDFLTDEEVGKIIRALFKHVKDGAEPHFKDRLLQTHYQILRNAVDRGAEKYEKVCEKRQAAAKKRWEDVQMHANASKSMQMHANADFAMHPDNDPDNDNNPDPDNDNEPDNDNGRGCGNESPTGRTTTTTDRDKILDHFKEQWNSTAAISGIPAVKYIAGPRADKLIDLVDEYGEGTVLDAVKSIEKSKYLKENQVKVDWFLEPENFLHITEGQYAKTFESKRSKIDMIMGE